MLAQHDSGEQSRREEGEFNNICRRWRQCGHCVEVAGCLSRHVPRGYYVLCYDAGGGCRWGEVLIWPLAHVLVDFSLLQPQVPTYL